MRLGLIGIVIASSIAMTVSSANAQDASSTVWGKLGIPQAFRGLRDGLVNRRGNFPGLEKKPAVKPIADPSNLEEGKPELLKTAAEIKQDQDLKKQKIKAIKFLGDVNCGCYNKDDGKVEKAFLESLEDCDADIREVAIETLDKIVGKKNCKCSDRCAITCCTEKIRAKLWDMATAKENGCFKEPSEDIRKAAKALFCKCPVPNIKPEELIPPDPIQPRNRIQIEGSPLTEEAVSAKMTDFEKRRTGEEVVVASVESMIAAVGRYKIENAPAEISSAPEVISNEPVSLAVAKSSVSIQNPNLLLNGKVVAYNQSIGEMVIQMPGVFRVQRNWQVLVVDAKQKQLPAKIMDVGGSRILVAFEDLVPLAAAKGAAIKIGLISK